jgi:hypothetical protein
MPARTDGTESWWAWFAMVLYLLLPVDLLTTLVSVSRHGLAVEANPVMRWLLGLGGPAVLAGHLLVTVLAVVLFEALVRSVRRVPPADRRGVVLVVDLWLATGFLVGVALAINNLLVIL